MRVKPLEMKNSNTSWLADFMTIMQKIQVLTEKHLELNGNLEREASCMAWFWKPDLKGVHEGEKWQTHNMCRKAGAWWGCTTNSSNSNQKFSMFIFCIWTRGRFTVHSWTRSVQGRCLGPKSSGRRKLWLSFCIGCQHSHLDQRKGVPQSLTKGRLCSSHGSEALGLLT